MPARRTVERDEAAVAGRVKEAWPSGDHRTLVTLRGQQLLSELIEAALVRAGNLEYSEQRYADCDMSDRDGDIVRRGGACQDGCGMDTVRVRHPT
ncbi:hypothetical protein [Streptomyces mirabilis]|uniref:hypothetical protein n=1 Tax=Streptomyces mirabilis TaxID=68239 RepID=UPI0036534FDF